MGICDKCGLTCSNSGALQRHINSCNLTKEDVKNIIDDYTNNHLSTKDICDKYKISFLKLKNYFDDYGLKFRNKSESGLINKIKYPIKHTHKKQRIEYLLYEKSF
jgi:hypothetical protein